MLNIAQFFARRPDVSRPDSGDLQAYDKQHIRLSYIVTCYFNKGTPDRVFNLLAEYETYSPEVLDRMQFIVVDDGSPIEFSVPDFNLNLTWLKIREDIPWNLGGARNLGVVYAKSDKIILADLDHIFPESLFAKALRMGNPGRRMYRFWRKERSTGKMRRLPHANSFFMSRARFLRFFGYDEEFCGQYGFFGGWITQFNRYHGTWVLRFPRRYHCILNDVGGVDHDHSLKRDKVPNRQLYLRKRNEVHYWGAEAGHSRRFLSFHWDCVKEHNRPRPEPRTDRVWKHLYWLRTLFGTYR